MRILPVFLLLVACNTPPDDALDIPPDADPVTLRAQALDAYQNGELDRFVALQEHVLAMEPDNTITRYNLACGYARTGKKAEAIRELRTLLEAGVDYGAAQDADFESLFTEAEFVEIIEAYQELNKVVSHGSAVARIGDRIDLAPEGVAYDPETDRTFVSSMRTGQIWVYDGDDGQARPFATLRADGVPLSAYGLAIDADRGLLWAVGSAFSLHEDYKPEHQGTTAVVAMNLRTGTVRSSHSPKVASPDRGFHDLAIAQDGTVYLSGGALYALDPEAEHPEPVPIAPAFESSYGITFGPDPDVLFVAANRTGIARVDLSSNRWSWMEVPEDADMRGIDSLSAAGDDLVGIQLGLNRWRAVRFDVGGAGTKIDGVTVLEQGHDDIAFATAGVVVDDQLRFAARAPLPPGTDRSAAGPAAGPAWIWTTPVRPLISAAQDGAK